MPDPSIFTSVIDSYLPEPHSSLLNGIIFGIPLKTTKTFYTQLREVGLLHIVVLSGMNITLLAAVITNLTIGWGKKVSVLIVIAVIVLFVLFVGPQPPIIRAAVMGILAHIAVLYEKKNFVLYALFLSGAMIYIIWPDWIKTVSFQLSYGATLGIVLFGAPKSQKNYILNELKPSLAAQLFTTPIIFYYFKEISIISPLSNILVSFTIVPIMIFGFMTAFLGKINYILGSVPAFLSYGLLNYIVFVVEKLSLLPFAHHKF